MCTIEIVRLFGACRRPCDCRTVVDNLTESYNLYLGWKDSGGCPRVSWCASNINTKRSRFDPVADYTNYCSTTHRVSAAVTSSAEVMELEDLTDSKSVVRKYVWVRTPPSAPGAWYTPIQWVFRQPFLRIPCPTPIRVWPSGKARDFDSLIVGSNPATLTMTL